MVLMSDNALARSEGIGDGQHRLDALVTLVAGSAGPDAPAATLAEHAGLSAPAARLLRLLNDTPRAVGPTPQDLARLAADAGCEVVVPAVGADAPSALASHALAVLTQPPADHPVIEDEDGVQILVDAGQRSRLWAQFPDETDRWFHMLVKVEPTPAEPVISLRYVHDNDPEELAVRWKRAGLVVHREVALPVATDRPVLVSVGVIAGDLRVHLDGIPVYCRRATYRAPTGFILDAIGIAGGTTKISLPFIAFEAGSGEPMGQTAEDTALLASGVVEKAYRSGIRSALHEALHALAGTALIFDHERIRAMIAALRQREGTFTDVLEDLLLARLPEEARQEFLATRPLPIARVRDVSIALPSNPADKSISRLLLGRRGPSLRVVDGVSFDAFAGDIVGIIGKNGAGKTTFLKSLVGAMPIVEGRIEIADWPLLLRPGAGMQSELTGRQNIYKSGLYMNMTLSEIEQMIDDVIDFAELRDHIDRPFKYYSDGMRARLIFSMATAVPRDILLLDELLSAGDLGFQERAMERLNRFLSRAKLVVVVQHTFDFVLSQCTKCLLLHKGQPVYFGEPRIATELYRELL